MKAKLIKVLDQYHLYDGDKAIATTIVGNPMLLPNLSKQNCDEIFGVGDVEELSMKNDKGIYRSVDGVISYRQGFNKAMELNKDKVFTLEQMSVAYNTNRSGTLFEQLINSFGGQPTEIEVEIELICPHPSDTYRCGIQYGCDEDGCNHPDQVPYLDSEGCLILKKV